MKRKLIEVSPKPKRGPWHYSKAYFAIGDKTPQGTIIRVYRNRYGRVSYHTSDVLLLLEDLAPKGVEVIP